MIPAGRVKWQTANGMIDVIVISMKRSLDRRARISARLEYFGIPFRIFDAIEGEALSQEERDRIAPPKAWLRSSCGRPALPGEIGCALSHLTLARANANRDFFCVLEDDGVPSSGLKHFLDENVLHTLPKFDALRLYSSPELYGRKYPTWELTTIGNYSICTALVIGGSTSGQIYSKSGAAKIISKITTVNAPIDDVLYMHPQIPGFRVIETRPSVVNNNGDAESTILKRPQPTSSLFVNPSKLIAQCERRIRLIQRFIFTWVLRDKIFHYPLWHFAKSKNNPKI
jgi:glycosyl transferase family 25